MEVIKVDRSSARAWCGWLGLGSRSGGLQATGRGIWKSHFLTFLQQEKQQTRENKRGGNERKQIKVSDTDKMDATSYVSCNEREKNVMKRMKFVISDALLTGRKAFNWSRNTTSRCSVTAERI